MRLFTSFPPALRHRDFRLLWLGQLISASGSMMQTAAILWHVYDVTHQPVALGLVGLVRIVPVVGLSLVSGLAADRFDRRKLMMFTQTGMAVCAALLGLLAVSGAKAVWPIYLLAALSSAFGAFDLPARQSLIPNLVPREDLPNAFSVNSTMMQAASVAGPALAGTVIAQAGVQWAYWFNAASFLAVIVALLAMRARPTIAKADRPAVSIGAALEGLRFVRRTPVILSTMLLDFIATFFSSANALLPIYAKDILHVGPAGYGWLYAAAAVGALVAAFILTFVRTINKQGPVLIMAVLIYGSATVLFGFSTVFVAAFLALALTGAADTVSTVIRSTLRQLNTPDHLRGRMVSVNMMFFMGGPQLGEMEAGLVAAWLGAPFSVISGGVACIAVTLWVARRWPQLWRYSQQPIPPAATASAD
ncbi:MAG: MFS transporter [Chloroflexi bacterium]|nr:MFS transporter [Chloroflexota bacterium]